MLKDQARIFIDAAAQLRAEEFVSPPMRQQIMIGVVEYLQGRVFGAIRPSVRKPASTT